MLQATLEASLAYAWCLYLAYANESRRGDGRSTARTQPRQVTTCFWGEGKKMEQVILGFEV